MSHLVASADVRAFVETLEPELWLGHMTEVGGFAWAPIVKRYLATDSERMTALAMSMLAGGNRTPIIVTTEKPSGVWDGNHRAAVAWTFQTPLRFVTVETDALIEASTARAAPPPSWTKLSEKEGVQNRRCVV